MDQQHTRLTGPRRLICCTLLVLLVYQFGACPCGCLEHNAWFQLVAVSDQHHDGPVSHPLESHAWSPAAEADDHSCTGQPHSPYLDTTRLLGDPLRLLKTNCEFFETLGRVLSIRPVELGRSRRSKRGPDSSALAHALSRPALQVYRL